MEVGPVHESLKPISFLIGKWKSTVAEGEYPTLQPFSYDEEIEFTSLGQPMLNYSSKTWHPVKKNPMHLESGFLRIKPGTNHLSFMIAQNTGLTSLEEGFVEGDKVSLKSVQISRMSFAKEPEVTEIVRDFIVNGDKSELKVSVSMATTKTSLKKHLSGTYKKYNN